MGEYTVRRFITIFFVLLLVLMLATASADMVSISELRQQAEAAIRHVLRVFKFFINKILRRFLCLNE